MTPSMRNWGNKALILSTPIVKKLRDYFLPKGIDQVDPTVSPLYADLKNMPPALFTIGTMDPLLDDSLFMYARWLSAGNEADLLIYPGGIHGFITMPTSQAEEARKEVLKFLKAKI
jgi:acetyl esterase